MNPYKIFPYILVFFVLGACLENEDELVEGGIVDVIPQTIHYMPIKEDNLWKYTVTLPSGVVNSVDMLMDKHNRVTNGKSIFGIGIDNETLFSYFRNQVKVSFPFKLPFTMRNQAVLDNDRSKNLKREVVKQLSIINLPIFDKTVEANGTIATLIVGDTLRRTYITLNDKNSIVRHEEIKRRLDNSYIYKLSDVDAGTEILSSPLEIPIFFINVGIDPSWRGAQCARGTEIAWDRVYKGRQELCSVRDFYLNSVNTVYKTYITVQNIGGLTSAKVGDKTYPDVQRTKWNIEIEAISNVNGSVLFAKHGGLNFNFATAQWEFEDLSYFLRPGAIADVIPSEFALNKYYNNYGENDGKDDGSLSTSVQLVNKQSIGSIEIAFARGVGIIESIVNIDASKLDINTIGTINTFETSIPPDPIPDDYYAGEQEKYNYHPNLIRGSFDGAFLNEYTQGIKDFVVKQKSELVRFIASKYVK